MARICPSPFNLKDSEFHLSMCLQAELGTTQVGFRSVDGYRKVYNNRNRAIASVRCFYFKENDFVEIKGWPKRIMAHE